MTESEFFDNIPKESIIFVKNWLIISERITAILEAKNWNLALFAEALGKEEEEVDRWLNSPYNFSLKTLAMIEAILEEHILYIPTPDEDSKS